MMQPRVWAVALLLGGAPPAAAQQPNPSFYLVNRFTAPLTRVFATPAGQPNWGQNRLANATIPAGGNFPIRLPADGKCVYDIKVVWANGRTEERRDLNTCEIDNLSFPANAAAAKPEQPSFTLINRSRTPVNELYLSATDEASWGEDRLGDDNLPAGGTKVIRLPPGECVYDVRVVFANGEASEKRRLNLCQISNLRVP